MSEKSTVEISKELYQRLLTRDEILMALEQAGVREWVRYDHAMKLLEQYRRDVE